MQPRQIASRASIGLLLVVFAIAVLSFGSPASAAPPAVQSDRSAQSNCQSIVNAGYSPNDYVLRGGKWRYEPGYKGTNSVRMSSLWGSASTCLSGSTVQPQIRIVVTPPKPKVKPAPKPKQNQNQVLPDPDPKPVIHDPEPEPLERREEERERQPHNMVNTGDPNVHIHYTGDNANDRSTWTWLRPDHDEWCTEDDIGEGCGRLIGEIDYEGGGRADPNKKNIKVPGTNRKVKNPRDDLSGAEWYAAYGTEHPKGSSYVPGKKDPDFDKEARVRRGNENSQKGCLWNGTQYVKSNGSTSGCTQPPPKPTN